MKFCDKNIYIIILWSTHIVLYCFLFDCFLYYEVKHENVPKHVDELGLLNEWIVMSVPFYLLWLLMSQLLCGNTVMLIFTAVLILMLSGWLIVHVVLSYTHRNEIADILHNYRQGSEEAQQ
jgi:hypothetical protein